MTRVVLHCLEASQQVFHLGRNGLAARWERILQPRFIFCDRRGFGELSAVYALHEGKGHKRRVCSPTNMAALTKFRQINGTNPTKVRTLRMAAALADLLALRDARSRHGVGAPRRRSHPFRVRIAKVGIQCGGIFRHFNVGTTALDIRALDPVSPKRSPNNVFRLTRQPGESECLLWVESGIVRSS